MPQLRLGCSLSFLSPVILGMMFAFGAPGVLAQSAIFNGPRNYTVGTSDLNINPIAIADFNGDGLPDIAVANDVSNDVSILLQNTDGTFQAAVSYPVGNQPFTLNVGDVNGDGKADLIVVNTLDTTLGVLLGNGDGTFQTQLTTALPVAAPSSSFYPFIVVGDWNGDGKTDVALAGALPQAGSNAIAVMLSNGDGTFQAPVTYSLAAAPYALNAADFNGDGKLDLVTADGSTGVSVWLGNGDGTFKTSVTTAASQTIWEIPQLLVGDFNQDGHLDIATATIGSYDHGVVPNLTLFLGNGDGTFQANVTSQQYIPYAVGDLDGDGKPDLLASEGFTVVAFMNAGNATFTPSAPSGPAQPYGLALFDLNGDQKLDLITTTFGDTEPSLISVLHGNGDGTFAQFPVYAVSPEDTSGAGLVVADFNNDGKPDLATTFVGPAGYLNTRILLNDGAGFLPPIDTAIAQVGSSGLGAGDFNHDGKVDLEIGDGNGGFFILLGKGDGTFQTAVDYALPPGDVGDVNGDGNLDFISLSGTQYVQEDISVVLGKSDGTFGFPVKTPLPAGVTVTNLVVGDFNGDGKVDVAALISNNAPPPSQQLLMLFGNADGTFTVGPTYTYTALSAPGSLSTGDLNGDGKLDLIVILPPTLSATTFVPAVVVALLGNGDGTFQNPVTTNTEEAGSFPFMIGDFNLDGKADLAIADGGISLLLGNGDGTFQAAPLKFFENTAALGLVVADFDGNGAPDLAVGGGSTGISILLNAAGSNAPPVLISPATLAFGSVHMGQSSSPQTASLANTATAALTIAGITISGAQGGDFSQTNSCGTTLAAGTSCTITVLFTPQASGGRGATIQITDSATNSPQVISLSGTGTAAPTIGLGVPSGGSSSATVPAGQPASYSLTIGGTGMSGTAALTCTGAPQGATCTVPASVTVSGTTASTVNVSVTTTARTLASAAASSVGQSKSRGLIGFGGMFAALLLGMVFVPVSWRKRSLKRAAGGVYLGVMVATLMLIASCGGSSSGSGSGTNTSGTAVGTYSLAVTATLNSATQTVALTLVVQ